METPLHKPCPTRKCNHETVISNRIRQEVRVLAQTYTKHNAQGIMDFMPKLEIALKEASETGDWLALLHRTNDTANSNT